MIPGLTRLVELLARLFEAMVAAIIFFTIVIGLGGVQSPVSPSSDELEVAARERLFVECTIAAPKAVAKKSLPEAGYTNIIAEREKCMRERKYVGSSTKE